MNNNILFNLINKFANINSQDNIQNSSVIQNMSDYPDVIFLKNKQEINNVQQTQSSPSNNILGTFLNNDFLKQLFPILFNIKSNNKSTNNFLENISPQFSQIMSFFSNSNKKKKEENKESKNVIDISNLNEID